jgi:hypothetical protein
MPPKKIRKKAKESSPREEEKAPAFDLPLVYYEDNKVHPCMAKDCTHRIVATDHHVICVQHLPQGHVLSPPKDCRACEVFTDRAHRRRKSRLQDQSTPKKTPAKSGAEGSAPSSVSKDSVPSSSGVTKDSAPVSTPKGSAPCSATKGSSGKGSVPTHPFHRA